MESSELLIIEFENALLHINRIKASEIFEKAYANDKNFDILEHLVTVSLERIGNGWEEGTISLSQVYMSGIICEELIEKYMPEMKIKRKDVPKIAIAVLQDHHALGKRIVYSILRAGGFEVVDFGQGLGVDELVEKAIDNQIEILLISTLMLPSALKVKAVKEKLLAQGLNIKILAGGAPFRLDPSLWERVGADADGKNATSIINTVEMMLKGDGK